MRDFSSKMQPKWSKFKKKSTRLQNTKAIPQKHKTYPNHLHLLVRLALMQHACWSCWFAGKSLPGVFIWLHLQWDRGLNLTGTLTTKIQQLSQASKFCNNLQRMPQWCLQISWIQWTVNGCKLGGSKHLGSHFHRYSERPLISTYFYQYHCKICKACGLHALLC